MNRKFLLLMSAKTNQEPTYSEIIQSAYGSSLIHLLPFDEVSGTTAIDYSGNSRNATYVNTSGMTLNNDLPPFRAPQFGATNYVNLIPANLTTFSFNLGSLHYWVRAPLANWFNSSQYRLAIFQADSSNRIEVIKVAGSTVNGDQIQFDYRGGGTSTTVRATNVSMHSGWFPMGFEWNKSGSLCTAYVDGLSIGTITSMATLVGTLGTIAQVNGNQYFPNSNAAYWSLGSDILGASKMLQLANQPRHKLIAFDGDSLTVGAQLSAVPYPKSMMQSYYSDIPIPNNAGYNCGNSSETYADMILSAPTTVDIYLAIPGFEKKILVAWGGTNDISLGADLATVQSRVTTYCSDRRTAGWRVVVGTVIPNGAMSSGEKTIRTQYNSWLITNYASFADAVVDFCANEHFDAEEDVSDTTYYNADTTHLTTAGYALIAAMAKSVVDSL